jgi:putative membrane protein
LHAGASEWVVGSQELTKGGRSVQAAAQRLGENMAELSESGQKLGAGLRQMEANRPRNSDLKKLVDGADSLNLGVAELGQGMKKLKQGSHELNTEVLAFKDEADSSLWVTPAIRSNVGQVAQGLQQLDQGLATATHHTERLEEGTRSLHAGLVTLSVGMRQLNGALRTTSTQFPEDAQLQALDTGAAELARGTAQWLQGHEKLGAAAQQLNMGLALVKNALPQQDNTPEGSPEGLADSVRPLMVVEASVQNNGIGFIANVMPAALWLGAGIAVFLVNLRVLPLHAKPYHPLAQLVGKWVLPAALVGLQGVLILLTVWGVLQVHVVQPVALVCTVLSAGLAFFGIISALTHFLGDAGKALAMVFLAIQLTSSGGVMPVELSGSFFATLSPWLPITWLAHGLKAALFGAFEGAWLASCLQLSALGLFAAGLNAALGRWRFVSVRQLRPQLDV